MMTYQRLIQTLRKPLLTQNRGLSLMEVLTAIAVMAIVMVAVGGSFTNLAARGANLKYQLMAMNDAKQIVEEARRVADKEGMATVRSEAYWNGDMDNQGGWVSNGTVFSRLPGAIRFVEFPDGTAGDPVHLRVNVSWQEQGATRNYKLDALVTKRT